GAIANKITDAGQAETIKSHLTMPVLANIDYSPDVQEADLRGKSVLEAGEGLLDQLRAAREELTRLIAGR
ncbi:MAG: hypothetical protein ACYST6_14535, partial [Planctomycetota bacterium]